MRNPQRHAPGPTKIIPVNDAMALPRTLDAALRQAPAANLALISVPGEWAAAEARSALRRGLHVMLFSDNVPIADEIALKKDELDTGCLLM